jgi:hypothetical protein
MTLVQKNIGNTAYYTDGVNYYTSHVVGSKSDALWIFACMDLGITKRSGFTTEESARINDLAGTGIQQKTKYLLLKNGQAVPVPYLNVGLADLHISDILLRHVAAPAALVRCPHCASHVLPGPVCSACGKQLTP